MLASTSNCMANQLRKVMNDENLQIYITPFGVNTDLFSPEKYKRVWEIIRANKITPEIEKEVESLAYEAVKNNRTSDVWAFSNETESHSPLIKSGQFDEWAKVLTAFARGAKRARPEVKPEPMLRPFRETLIKPFTAE